MSTQGVDMAPSARSVLHEECIACLQIAEKNFAEICVRVCNVWVRMQTYKRSSSRIPPTDVRTALRVDSSTRRLGCTEEEDKRPAAPLVPGPDLAGPHLPKIHNIPRTSASPRCPVHTKAPPLKLWVIGWQQQAESSERADGEWANHRQIRGAVTIPRR